MKPLFYTTSIVLLISVIISATFGTSTPTSNAETPNSLKPITYIVKEYDGKVAVFENGANIPFKITDVYTKNLPQEDKLLLSQGISVDTDQELALLLADYCS